MRLRHLLLVLCFTFLPANAFTVDKAHKIDQLLQEYHDAGLFSGTALVAQHGKILTTKAFGFANMEWEIPNELDTRFRIGSITKQFTAVLVLQLVEKGSLSLDDPVSKYITDYPKENHGSKITIRQLLTHTSGLPNYATPRYFSTYSRLHFEPVEFMKLFWKIPLDFQPGSDYRYSNSGYYVLGVILEKVTGQTFEQLLRKTLDPLGMSNTGYEAHSTILKKRAYGYTQILYQTHNAQPLDMSTAFSASGMYSTVGDLFLWDQALYTEKLLSRESLHMLFEPEKNNYAFGWIVRSVPEEDLHRFLNDPTSYKERGILVQRHLLLHYHGGGVNGFNATILRLPEDRNLIVLLNNTGNRARLQSLNAGIVNILYNKLYDRPKKSVSEALFHTIMEKNVEAAIEQYEKLRSEEPYRYDFSERELNTLGYQMISLKRYDDAVAIFKVNVRSYPRAFNTYDSLAEAYLLKGDRSKAKENYKKSLHLNPENRNAALKLKELNDVD